MAFAVCPARTQNITVHRAHPHLFLLGRVTIHIRTENPPLSLNPPPTRRVCAMSSSTTRRSAAVQLALISKDKVSPQDAKHVLTAAFTAEDYSDCIKDLNGCEIDPQAYMDGLDQVGSRTLTFTTSTLIFLLHQIIDNLSPQSEIYRSGLRALREACGIYGLLPYSYIKPGPLTRGERVFSCQGNVLYLWKARDSGGCLFAVRQIPTYEKDDFETKQKALRSADLLSVSVLLVPVRLYV